MKKVVRGILLFSIVGLLVNCDEEDVNSRDFPRLKGLPVSENNIDGVRFSADFMYRGDFEILRYGFVWARTENPTLEDTTQVVYAGDIKADGFSVFIENDLKRGATYFFRAFVETNDFLVYSQNVGFESEGICNAFIESFSPTTGLLLDTVTIRGNGFSPIPEENIVRFGQERSTVLSSTESEIRAIVPVNSRFSQRISIEVDGTTCASLDQFNVIPPRIINAQGGAAYCQSMTFTTSNFQNFKDSIEVRFGERVAYAQSVGKNQFSVIVPPWPEGINTEPVLVLARSLARSGVNVALPKPEFTFTSLPVDLLDTLIIGYTTQLSSCDFEIRLGGRDLELFDLDVNRFKVVVPSDINFFFFGGRNQIPFKITAAGVEILDTTLTLAD